jgi:hypothetical protein
MYYKVKDRTHLVRDSETKAIINTNSKALEEAKLRKDNKLKQEKRLDILENKLEQILDILNGN